MLTNHDKSACSEWTQNLRSSYPAIPSGLYVTVTPQLDDTLFGATGPSSTCWADFWSAAEVLSRTGNACSSFGQDAFRWKTHVSLFGSESLMDILECQGLHIPKGMWPKWRTITASIYHNLPLLHRPLLRQNRLSDKIIRWVSEQVWDSVGYANII